MSPTKEKKIQLMQDIAAEFSIRWDSRTFEHTISNSSASVPVCSSLSLSLTHSLTLSIFNFGDFLSIHLGVLSIFILYLNLFATLLLLLQEKPKKSGLLM